MKKTLYEILGILPSASHTEIQAAFRRLVQQHATQNSSSDDIQLKAIHEAYSTLSDYGRRSGYDASLAARAAPARIEVEIHEPRRSAQKTLLLVIGTLIAIGMTIQIGFMLLSFNRASKALAASENFNEQKRMDLENIEAEMTQPKSIGETEARQAVDEERKRVADERRLADEERQRARELEESRRYAERISSERIRAEEQARRQADSEQKRVEQEELRRKQQEEQAAMRQLSNDKRRLQELESQNRR